MPVINVCRMGNGTVLPCLKMTAALLLFVEKKCSKFTEIFYFSKTHMQWSTLLVCPVVYLWRMSRTKLNFTGDRNKAIKGKMLNLNSSCQFIQWLGKRLRLKKEQVFNWNFTAEVL